jgi:hypothetical protein
MRYHRRRIMVICTKTAKAEKIRILLCQRLEILTHLMLGKGIWEIVLLTIDDIFRHIGVEFLKGPYSDSVQHPAYVIFRMWKI